MPQDFYVLRCYSCSTFQVHQVKKAKKWNCKLCGEKQSTQKIFGQGSGADCRRHVQKLNMMRAQLEEVKSERTHGSTDLEDKHMEGSARVEPSRWASFLEAEGASDEGSDGADESGYTTNRQHFERTKQQHRKAFSNRFRKGFGRHPAKSSPYCSTSGETRPQFDSQSAYSEHPQSVTTSPSPSPAGGATVTSTWYNYSCHRKAESINRAVGQTEEMSLIPHAITQAAGQAEEVSLRTLRSGVQQTINRAMGQTEEVFPNSLSSVIPQIRVNQSVKTAGNSKWTKFLVDTEQLDTEEDNVNDTEDFTDELCSISSPSTSSMNTVGWNSGSVNRQPNFTLELDDLDDVLA